ncbi:MAG: hypothetical protein ACRD3I_09500, partial [Terriglobales bacterium]
RRPFRVPSGLAGAVLIGVFPLFLLSFSVIRGQREQVLGMNALLFGILIIAAGVLVYLVRTVLRRRSLVPVANDGRVGLGSPAD